MAAEMSRDELREFSALHLHYEIDMCEKAARFLPSGAADHILNNVLLESYAVHLRNLIEFLYWIPTRDDVNALHFVKSPEAWLAARGPTPDLLKAVKTRADKQIAHLTKQRFADGAPERVWEPGREVLKLLKSLRLFLDHADEIKLDPKVRQAVTQLEALYGPAEGRG